MHQEQKQIPLPEAHALPIRVLLVEDSSSDARLTTIQLHQGEEKPIEVVRATMLKEALTLLTDEPPVDAMILDLSLPDSKGSETIRAIRATAPHLPVVVLSGEANEVSVFRALDYGAEAFLLKGECSAEALKHAVYDAIFKKSLRR